MASIRFSSRAWMSSCCSAGVRSSSSRAAHLTIAISSLSPSASSSLLSFSLSAEEARSPPSTPFNPRCSTSTSILRRPTAADLSSLTIPSLKCSFPALVHADYEAVKGPCDAWIEAVAAPPSPAAARFLHDCLLPLFVCRLIPQAISQQRLVRAIKAIAWLMIADDDDDHPDLLGSDVATTSRRADLVMAILRGGDEEMSPFDWSFMASTKPSFASKSARMLKALSEVWLEICKEMSPSLRARFISSMADYFEGIKVQASFRKEGTIPDVESYIKIRRQASFTIPIFILMEYALGIDLDITTFPNPIIQELHDVALDYISLCNDIVSCCKEIHMGDYFNLPFILYNSVPFQWSFTPFQYAMDHVAQMSQDLNNRAIFLISMIHEESQKIEPYMVPIIYAYVDGLSLCMSGALAWFFETARYQQANGCNEFHQLAMEEKD